MMWNKIDNDYASVLNKPTFVCAWLYGSITSHAGQWLLLETNVVLITRQLMCFVFLCFEHANLNTKG